MKLLIVLTTLYILVAIEADDTRYENPGGSLWRKYRKEYGKTFKDNADQRKHRAAFDNNLKEINELNEKDPQRKYEINKYTDYTDEELEDAGEKPYTKSPATQ